MRTSLLTVSALAATVALSACSGGAPQVDAPKAPPPAPASSAPASSAPASSAPASSAPASSAPASSEPSQGGGATGGQATADAAGQAFLRSLGSGDGKATCSVMAAQGQPVSSIPQAKDICEKTFGQVAQQVAKSSPELKSAEVKGATANGDSADFAAAKVTPPMGSQLLQSMKAVKISGKWYISN